MKTIALFGGTFNPVHFGHLRMALELKELLELDEMRLLPSRQPAHRAEPGASAQARRDMVALAVENCPQLQLDERELNREGPTYTVDTLEELRQELGNNVSLSFCMGLDSLLGLPAWHRWEKLTELAHLIVVTRPGWQIPQGGEVAELLAQHRGEPEHLRSEAAGRILLREQTLLPISATGVRKLIRSGRSAQYLLPERVYEYIQAHRLYQRREQL
ncbi:MULTISPECIES: nicotinate-nucleotide adenylyltransferase [Microbulbifer]|uniref:Probable nicotinate-nucleotide adenylyltransferase n=1 Tax=Microbulbifer celer TaxID=435905 RepID=A0ABW3UCW1_9GAMM|nr:MULTISPECIES: nicotinate-nucleotide adenylyltransferase [Microbulbifer]UFN56000.1 nicotinate-nucleotide adenylyltransferase [Microbulbifer celer]